MFTYATRTHDVVTQLSTWVGSAILFITTAMYVYEVVVRYLFNAPTTWTSDWTSYFLAVVIFTLVPELARSKGHITIELLPEMLASTPRRYLETITMMTAVAACVFCAWVAFGQTLSLYKTGVVTVASATTPKWWIMGVIAYGFFSAGLHFLRHGLSILFGYSAVSSTDTEQTR